MQREMGRGCGVGCERKEKETGLREGFPNEILFLLFQRHQFNRIQMSFEFWSKPLITIKSMHQHECMNNVTNFVINFSLTRIFSYVQCAQNT
jgi:hypothetical protein